MLQNVNEELDELITIMFVLKDIGMFGYRDKDSFITNPVVFLTKFQKHLLSSYFNSELKIYGKEYIENYYRKDKRQLRKDIIKYYFQI